MANVRQLAKDIRASLKTQPAYLNQQLSRTRIYDARSTRDGGLLVKVVSKRSPDVLVWINVGDQSISIFAGTVMEELLTLPRPRLRRRSVML